jgi:hypothetical protein
MDRSLLTRIAPAMAVVAGVLVVLTRLVIMTTTPTDIEGLTRYVLTPTHLITSVVSILAFALLVLALVASYDVQAGRAKVLGLIGMAAALVGTVFMAGDWWYEAYAVPRLAETAPEVMATFATGRLLLGGLTSFVLFGVGWLLYGIASLRAGVLPVLTGWGMVVGGFLSGVPFGFTYLPGSVILGLAFVWLGVTLPGRLRRTREREAVGMTVA